MSLASRPPTAPSRPSLSAPIASRLHASHKRSASTSTSAPTLLPIKLTPHELEANLHSLSVILQDTTSHEWDSRIAALSQLQSIALGCQLTATLPLLVQHFRPLRQPLCQQIGDLRSSVVRSACSTLSTIAQLCGHSFSDECDAVIPALLRLVAVSVAVIAQSGDECVRAMLRFCSPTRGLTAIVEAARGNSSAVTRARAMEYIVLWLEERKRRVYEEAAGCTADEGRWEAALEGLIRDKLADKTDSVRVAARKAAVLYCRLWEDSGRRLLDGLDDKVRRLVDDERRRDGAVDNCPPPAAAGGDRAGETERRAVRSSVSTKRRSMSVKVADEATAPVVADKENSHPNSAVEQSHTVQLPVMRRSALRRHSSHFVKPSIATQPAATASAAEEQSPPVPAVRAARRQSIGLVRLVAADSDGAKRLTGARRVSVAPPPAQHDSAPSGTILLPPRPPKPLFSTATRPPIGLSAASVATSAAVAAETIVPLPSPTVVSVSEVTIAVHALTEEVADVAITDSSVATAPVKRSIAQPAARDEQVLLGDLPAERERPTGRAADSLKRKSVGAVTTNAVVPASLIPRRASYSLPAELKPPTARPASIKALLASACEGRWSARVAALDAVAAQLSAVATAPRGGLADVESHLDRLVCALADSLHDSHPRVVAASLSALAALLDSCSSVASLPPQLCPHLGLLLSSLFHVLSHPQPSVKQQCDGLLTALCGVYPGLELLPPLLSLLSASSALSSAERAHAREFASYACEWGDERQRRAKRDMVDAAPAQRQQRPQQPPAQPHARRIEPLEATEEGAEQLAELHESEYETDSDEEWEDAAAEESPAAALPACQPVSPPHSLALSPGLARRLVSPSTALSPPAATAATSRQPAELFPADDSVISVAPPAAGAYTPPSLPAHARVPATPPALSFPLHSIFPAPPATAARPASVEKAATRPASSASHQRSLSASSAPSLPAARPKPAARTTQKAKKRISLPAASLALGPSYSSAASAMPPPARRSPARPLPVSLSDTDVSALIYQWKHADLLVVAHSLHFATQQLRHANAAPLCNAAVDRIVAAAIALPATHPTTTPAVVALLSAVLSPALCGEGGKDATRLAVHLQTAAFPHAAGIVELVTTAHAQAAASADKSKAEMEAVEQLWSAVQRYCHRPTLVTAITAQLSAVAPTHHSTLTLLLTSLSTLLPGLSSKAVEAGMAGLSHVLCLLLCHEQVVVRKQCVTVWVSCWRVLGAGVERWMSGLTAVSRRLVDIYLNKAKEEQKAAEKS